MKKNTVNLVISLLFIAFTAIINYANSGILFQLNNIKNPLGFIENTTKSEDDGCGITPLPFTEDFEFIASIGGCWQVFDNNKDGTASMSKWLLQNAISNAYKGSYSYSFNSANNTKHDDWLVSPTFDLDANAIYKLSYYYKAPPNKNNEVSVVLSTQGTNIQNFTTILDGPSTYINATYKQKTIYITGIQGNVNIAWHVTSTGATTINIDTINLEKVDCKGIQGDIDISNIQMNEATASWTDTTSQRWEYWVQPWGLPTPVASGSVTTTPSVNLKTLNTNQQPLQPNTDYAVYVKAVCTNGSKLEWIGPIHFKTQCTTQQAPFWEGFNVDSQTLGCWTIVDANQDYYNNAISNKWTTATSNQYEGNQCMYFAANNATTAIYPHNDWLISPSFKVEANKKYRLRFHYKTTANNEVDFKVLYSDKGTDIKNFTNLLLDKPKQTNSVYMQEAVIVGGFDGVVNFAFQVTTPYLATFFYIDNVFFEEIQGCPEPTNLGVDLINPSNVTLKWLEPFGQSWEYVVQEKVGITPTNIGTTATSTSVLVTQDKNGTTLKSNTEYEYYVRTVCKDGSKSAWSGPYVFRTACGVFSATPFYEHFNVDSQTINCWTVLDENKDSTYPPNYGIWRPFAAVDFVGSRIMRFMGMTGTIHDDWLISPKIECKPGKIYRLKYLYKTDPNSAANFEVLVAQNSVSPVDFNRVLVPDTSYKLGNYEEHTSFITGLSGLVNLAWRTKGDGFKLVHIDNISLEEVTNCPEPLILGAKDIEVDKATIYWTEEFNASSWQYYIQPKGQGTPTGTGVTSSNPMVTVNQTHNGQSLLPNTEYEFYVRSLCSNGGYSDWSEATYFTTLCGTYQAPFIEGFNADSATYRCWRTMGDTAETITSPIRWKNTTTSKYEGDRGIEFGDIPNAENWLLSPVIKLDGGTYVLKYHYKANANFEVLLSTKGQDPTDFITPVVISKTYTNTNFIEEVAIISGINSDVTLAWHVTGTTRATLQLDNVIVKKISSCPEPYNVQVSTITTNTANITWNQDTGLTTWDVRIVDYKQPATATAIQSHVVNGLPQLQLNGLPSGKAFTVYIRTLCMDKQSYSDWSHAIDFGTLSDVNNTCNGAYEIIANNTSTCITSTSVSFSQVSKSVIPEPSCGSVAAKNDIWFKFTATNKTHIIELKDWKSSINMPTMFSALYDVPCNAIGNTAVECFNLMVNTPKKVFKNLIPGNQYYLRLASTVPTAQGIFTLCITTPDYLQISPSGDKYSVDELISKVLVKSSCNLVSNVAYQNGDGSPLAMQYNTIGSFEKGTTDFPFEKGIILSTNEIQYAYGPAQATSRDFRGNNDHRWVGDKDINDAILSAGGAPNGVQDKRVTQLEFDFIPIKDSVQFEYVFASNSYYADCNSLGCAAGALFAAWLVDTTTGEGQNVAKINNTELPIALNTIINPLKTGKIACPGSYPELYWKHYTPTQDDPFSAYIDFVGLTRPMKSASVAVVPGRKYHIKLAVMDFCTIVAHSSAVLFNAGSFDLGDIDLGEDLTIAKQNALCAEQKIVLDTKLVNTGELTSTVQWYKDGQLMLNEINSTLEVSEAGLYKVIINTPEVDCVREDETLIEFYPKITSLLPQPTPLTVCRYSSEDQVLDLSSIERQLFTNENKEHYQVSYYTTKEQAENQEMPMDKTYVVTQRQNHFIYVHITDTTTGCTDLIEVPVLFETGELPQEVTNVDVCGYFEFPSLAETEYYYSESDKKGVNYKIGEQLNDIGEHTIYVVKDNGSGCYEQTSFVVSITEQPIAQVMEDQVLQCEYYILPNLDFGNKYFTEKDAQGTQLIEGTIIKEEQRIWIYTQSENGRCTDQSSFLVSFLDCPIPKGISPNGDGLNDNLDLSFHNVQEITIFNRFGSKVYAHGVGYTDQWRGQNTKGTLLPNGTYYYVVVTTNGTKTGWIEVNY